MYKRRPYGESIQLVQSKRCCIHISEALLNQLREFEAIYQNREVSVYVCVYMRIKLGGENYIPMYICMHVCVHVLIIGEVKIITYVCITFVCMYIQVRFYHSPALTLIFTREYP